MWSHKIELSLVIEDLKIDFSYFKLDKSLPIFDNFSILVRTFSRLLPIYTFLYLSYKKKCYFNPKPLKSFGDCVASIFKLLITVLIIYTIYELKLFFKEL